MRMLIIGGGAIGGVTAAYLTRAGVPVTLLCRDADTAERLRTAGMRVTGRRGELTVPLDAACDAGALTGPFDYILIVTKSYDMPEAARSALPLLAENGVMVSLQNGVCLEALAAIAGRERTAACIVSFSSTKRSDTQVEFTGEGGYLLGYAAAPADERLRQLAALLSHAAPAQVTDEIFPAIYAKLIINSGITCGGALCGLPLGRMLALPAARRFFIAIVREDMALAAALGIRVPPFGGKLDYAAFLRGDGLLGGLKRQLTLFAVGFRYRSLTSSSLTSLRRGKPTEVDYLNGWIAETARAHGVPVPVNARLTEMIRQIEAGTRPISPDNLRELMGGPS